MILFNIIVALDSQNGIGKQGKLPWALPGELKHFKEITTKTQNADKMNVVIMGRKTWDSIPEKFRPLPKRINIVLSKNHSLVLPADVIKAENFQEALSILEDEKYKSKVEGVFVIGGQQIFEEALFQSAAHKIYATHIAQDFDCDTFFPSFSSSFKEKSSSQAFQEDSISYRFAEYLRK